MRVLSRPDRLKLAEALTQKIEGQKAAHAELNPPPRSLLELRAGFYVYTGRLGGGAIDHRVDREDHADRW